MKYLDRLKVAGAEKKVFAGGQALPKLTKLSEMPKPELTKPTKPGSVSSAGTGPATKKSCEPGKSNVESALLSVDTSPPLTVKHISASGDLEARIRAMATRWGFTLEELAEQLALAAADSAKALQAVEYDEAQTVLLPRLSLAQEAARREVLAQLETHPNVERAFVNRFEADGTLVVTLAIRGVGTGELKIPTNRFSQDTLDDYGALLNTIKGCRQ